MGVRRARVRLGAALAILPLVLAGCGIGGDEPTEEPGRAPAEEAALRSRERVQAYLDAMTAKDVAAGRGQFCAVMHEGFDAASTGPNGDFADHFTVTQAAITDVRPGPRGQEVSTSVTVSVGSRPAVRPLLFTVTRNGADWCISGEAPGGNEQAEGTASPAPVTAP